MRALFLSLAHKYSQDSALIETLWNEIERAYAGKKRLYHNMGHLEHLYTQLQPVRERLEDEDAVWFALFYHDLVYKVRQHDNEEKSAQRAQACLSALGFPVERIERCVAHILATKGHAGSNDPDTNLFTDADLSILGQEENMYEAYCKAVRKEYAIYPDLLYRSGRRKVVRHFLEMARIYKTDYFFERLESTARKNLEREASQC